MTVVADTHVHLYPCYDLSLAIRRLAGNLGRHVEGQPQRAGFLVERHDCDIYRDLVEKRIVPDERICLSEVEDGCLQVSIDGAEAMYLFAGRQLVTAERVEILALMVTKPIDDGLSATETVSAVLEASGLPVVAWAPGKWFFSRFAVVESLLDSFSPGQLLLGDSTLRPTIWPEPVLMKKARSAGFNVVAGSDPLPFAGEEAYMGQYALALDGSLDESHPVTSARELLALPHDGTTLVGKRCGPVSAARRVFRTMRQR